MNRRDPTSPKPADRFRSDDGRLDSRERLVQAGPAVPRPPAADYPYGPGFSQSGGSYVDIDIDIDIDRDRGRSAYGGDAYQRVRQESDDAGLPARRLPGVARNAPTSRQPPGAAPAPVSRIRAHPVPAPRSRRWR